MKCPDCDGEGKVRHTLWTNVQGAATCDITVKCTRCKGAGLVGEEWTFTTTGHPLVLIGEGPRKAAVLRYVYTYAGDTKGSRYRVYFPHTLQGVKNERKDFDDPLDALTYASLVAL